MTSNEKQLNCSCEKMIPILLSKVTDLEREIMNLKKDEIKVIPEVVQKSKVAVIAWQFPNRSNTFIVSEMMELHRAGIDITIYSLSKPTAECEEIYKEELKVLREKIINIPELRLLDYKAAKDNQIPFFRNYYRQTLELCKTIDPSSENNYNQQEQEAVQNSKGFLKDLIKHIQDSGVNKIYAPFAGGDAEKAMMISYHTGIPYYFTAHAFDLFSSYYYQRMKAKTVEHVFVISEYNKKHMIENLGMPEEKITVRRVNFLAPDEKNIKSKDLGVKYIFSAGRLDEMKGYEYSIKAFAEFHKIFPDVYYLIVGSGDLELSLKQLVKDLKLEGFVHFLGHVSNHTVLEFAKDAEFSILSSIETNDKDKEGLPTCFVESMSLGTPCIGTDYSGVPELIDHGVNGMLAKQKDIQDITSKMTQLYKMIENDRSGEISKSCKIKITTMFDNQKNINLLVNHLK